MKGLSLLIPVLIIAIVSAQNADYAVNLAFEDSVPYIRVYPFTFGGSSYTIMAHGKIDTTTGHRTLIHAFTDNVQSSEDQGQVIVTLVNHNQLKLTFGRDANQQTVTTSSFGVSPNVFFSFILTVSKVTDNSVNVVAYFNNRQVVSTTIKGIAAAGIRSAIVGAQTNRYSNTYFNSWNGVIDNVAIINGIPTDLDRRSHVSTKQWAPSTESKRNLALWLNFDDPLAQLEDTAVGIVGIDGPNVQWVEATLHNSASFVPHIVSDQWKNCQATGDPHYYAANGAHINGGEHTKYGKVFLGCSNAEAEVRTYTRYTIWWGATVFRCVGVRYKDWVWRVNLDERHTSPDDTRAGTPYCRLGYAPGTYMKHISTKTWTSIGDGTRNHDETGVRYTVWGNRQHLKVIVPQIITVEVHSAGRYMNVYTSINYGICSDRYGACEFNMAYEARIDFEDWLPPAKLPDFEVEQNDACDGVEPSILTQMQERCRNIYPTNDVLYEDCLYDACASGDVDMISEVELTPECLLERLTSNGESAVSCTVTKCTNGCYGRGTCNVNGVCDCTTPGYGGNDCYQMDNFKCMEASYTSVSMNIEPQTIFDTSAKDDHVRRFGEYTVFRSLLINPVSYKGSDYLNFVFSDPSSPTSGSAHVCITENGAVTPGAPVVVGNTGTAVGGSVSVSGTWVGSELCLDVKWPSFVAGGFYIELTGEHDLTISVTQKSNIEQVLVGSANGRGGVDVAKIPESEHTGFSFATSDCDNTVCHSKDGDCDACYQTEGCGYCLESDRCMLGTSQGPRRGICRNWRFDLDDDVSRVVTTVYGGDDLVDPDYEVFLGSLASGSSVPVNIFVPTGRTNDNIDLHFVFGITGSYAINAGAIKSNLLNAMLNLGQVNLGIGYYGSESTQTSLTMTAVGENNRYLFGRAMEAPRQLVTGNPGGQFRALRTVAGEFGAGVGFRRFSRKIVVIMTYDIPPTTEGKAEARKAVAKAGFLPIWLIPTDVNNEVAEYYQDLADSIDGIPSIVMRTDPSGANWVNLFNKIITLGSSFPHIVIDNVDDEQYTHVDTDALAARADSLNILGLTNSAFRARFVLPMKKGDNNGHRTATITVPGFGSSSIKDVDSQVPKSYDKEFKGLENARCINVVLSGSVFNNLYKPVYVIETLPLAGTLYTSDLAQVVTVGAYSKNTFCFVPEPYDYSNPETEVYASFTYTTTDGCQSSPTSTVKIYVAGIEEAPKAEPIEIIIKEDDQDAPGFTVPINFVGFEADRDASDNLQTVTITYFEVTPTLNDLFESVGDVFQTRSDGQTLNYDTPYGPFTPQEGTFDFTHELQYVPTNKDFFGTVQTNARLFDGGQYSKLIPIKITVTPVNDVPVATVETEQFTLEDNVGTIQLKADDIDSFGLSFDVRVDKLPASATLKTPTGTVLTQGAEWYENACVGSPRSRTITCDFTLDPASDAFSCDTGGVVPADLSAACPTSYATITVRASDNNNQWEGGVGFSNEIQVNYHVLAVNDPPITPQPGFINLKEDDVNTFFDILGSDIDSESSEIDIFVTSLPNINTIQLYQVDESGNKGDQILSEAELNDWNLKRQFTQNHRLIIESTANIHGTTAPDFELGTFEIYAFDGELKSDKALVTVYVKPINDAPVPLVTEFSKNEDDNSAESSILVLTASDVDNSETELVYRITQLPSFDDENELGIKVYTVTEDGERGILITDLDTAAPGFVVPRSDGVAKLWIENLPNWYLRDETDNVLTYTVTDQDNYLEDTDADYAVNVVPQDVVITIYPVNDAPVISWTQPEGLEDSAIVITLFGEDDAYAEDDTIVAQVVQIQTVYSQFYMPDEKGFYQYSDDLVADPTDLTNAIPINPGDDVLDTQFRILYIPPANLNSAVNPITSPLYVSPSFTYKMTETESHVPPLRNSPESDFITVNVLPVNDAPVAYGGEWTNDPKFDGFYNIPDEGTWLEPANLCYDNCQFKENFGSTESFISSLPTELIYFGGRDVEGDDLSVTITGVDCLAGAELFLVSESGQEPISHADLVGRQLDIQITRYGGYSLTAGLAFRPAINDWNKVNPEESREEGHVYPIGAESDHYCLIEYIVVDSENLGSQPKTIEIDVMQVNTQPLEIFQFPEGDLSNDYSQAQATSTIISVDENDKAFLYLNATDAEGDDFVASIVRCGTRGSFFLPSAEQAANINNGILDLSVGVNALFDLDNPVACDDENQVNVELGTTFFETGKQGWYLLFYPGLNEVGVEYNSIVIAYDDNVVEGQLPTQTTRDINVNTVNNAPYIIVENQLVAGENGSNIEPQPITLVKDQYNSLGLTFGDLEALDENNDARAPYYFRIAVLSVPEDPETREGEELPDAFSWKNFDINGFAKDAKILKPNFQTGNYGYIQFSSSIGVANEIINGLQIRMHRIGQFVIEIVVIDNGFLGVCPTSLVRPDPAELDNFDSEDYRKKIGREGDHLNGDHFRCIRESTATITLNVTENGLVTATIATAAGAAILCLVALGAVAAAKIAEPKDKDAWKALGTAEMEGAITSGIHQSQTVTSTSPLYQA